MAQKRLQEAKNAAIKIQATYRGYRTRKLLRHQREMENMKHEPLLLASEVVYDIVTSATGGESVTPACDGTLKVTFDCSSKAQMAARTIQVLLHFQSTF